MLTLRSLYCSLNGEQSNLANRTLYTLNLKSVYNNNSRIEDILYGIRRCNSITKVGNLCINRPNVNYYNTLGHCKIHENHPISDPTLLLSVRFLERYTTNYDDVSIISNSRNLIRMMRGVFIIIPKKVVWFLIINLLVLATPPPYCDLRSIRYVHFTVNLDGQTYHHCLCGALLFDIPKCKVCGLFNTRETDLVMCYNNKDIVCGLLFRQGLLAKYLPRELILMIFKLALCVSYPGRAYKTKKLEYTNFKKNEKIMLLLPARVSRRNEYIETVKLHAERIDEINKEYALAKIELKRNSDYLKIEANKKFADQVLNISSNYPKLKPTSNPNELTYIKCPNDYVPVTCPYAF